MARGGLGQRQSRCRAADMAFREQYLKDDQQVQVGATKINLVHRYLAYYALDCSEELGLKWITGC
jgi:hypothetical protein